MDGLRPGEQIAVSFQNVKLKMGERKLEATLDPSGVSTYALEHRVMCADE